MQSLHLLSVILLLLGFVPAAQQRVFAQDSASTDTVSKKAAFIKSSLPSVQAMRLEPEETIDLDGKLDEAVWKSVQIATGFTQRVPDEGAPASEKTDARVIYTEQAIYIGIKAFDSSRDSIAATLFRKDGQAYSDWVYVNIDSYDDNRTSFSFAVNPKGVRKDILTYNDNNEDLRWDAVWEAETDIQDDGWSVEMRIPLSQLRFNAKNPVQNWGINFQRRIARKEEIAYWSPTPQNSSGLVSRYGQLYGIKDLAKPGRLEITPYASTSLTRAPGLSSNPFYRRNDFTGSAGADIKYGLTSDFTLTATVNPDFGQVEADPAVINLSAFETFFPEQRPFFLEGTDIFEFGQTQTYNTFGNPLIFYSRRIGRQPQGSVSDAGIDAEFTDGPDQTTIASAAKVSGKTSSGLSVGILNAFTVREKATFTTPGEEETNVSIEPPTNYFVGRLKQDFKGGRTILGGYASAVNRFIDADYLKSDLHESAYVGGFDFEHSWNDRDWIISGVVSGTSVNGSREAILQTQTSSARYLNRVDSDYLSVDSARNSLKGYAGEFSFAKFGGEHWRGSVTYSVVSPGYEVNDVGFENRADYQATSYYISYQENDPKKLRNYEVWTFAGHSWNFDGDLITNYYRAGGSAQFNNLWSLFVGGGFNGKQYMDRITRGGPIARQPKSWNIEVEISSDETKKVSFDIGSFYRKDTSGKFDLVHWTELQLRPVPFVQLEIEPQLIRETDTDQYVQTVSDPTATNTFGNRYVFADIDRTTFETSFRLDWTFTPDITLQTYVRPFISSGNFYNYKEFTRPRTYEFDIYGEDKGTIGEADGTYTVDPDGTGPANAFTFEKRDFNFRSIQTNAVFRWEYKPGSLLYLVWQQDRSATTQVDDFRFRRDLQGIFNPRPTNVFLIKLSYWFGT